VSSGAEIPDNALTSARDAEATIISLLRATFATDAHEIALASEEMLMTYEHLERRVATLAAALLARGVSPGDLVAVSVSLGTDRIAAILACLWSGAAYVPLDASQPDQRLAAILDAAGSKLLVTDSQRRQRLSSLGVATLDVDDPQPPAMAPAVESTPEDIAYVLFTSGTTGLPKGVEVTHRGVICLVEAVRMMLLAPHGVRRILQFAPDTFDSSVAEIFSALLNGLTLVLPMSDPAQTPPDELFAHATRQGVDMVTVPPSYLLALEDSTALLPRVVIVAGERCPPELVRRWASRTALYNGYGPTEVSVAATYGRLVPDDARDVPIGRPLPHLHVAILVEDRPVEPGETGELHVGGPSLARGYLGDPELTASRFRQIADADGIKRRMYATGDLVRARPDGQLVFEGRADRQVKLRGQRIELNDVEQTLLSAPDVHEAVVLAEHSGGLVRRLVAFVSAVGDISAEDLRQHVRGCLPAVMVPSEVVLVSSWPKKPSGKIDHDALLELLVERADETADNQDSHPDDALAAIWSEVLEVPRVTAEDDFFALGGHSILAMRIVALVRRQFGLRLPVRLLYENPVFSDFSARITELAASNDRESESESTL
jgi:amino acid adenylation domain-containing protein